MALTTYIIAKRFDVLDTALDAVDPDDPNPAEVEPEVVQVFKKIGAVNAHSTEQALRKAAEQHGGGYLLAVSERHWKGEEFEVETVTRVKVKTAA